MSHVKVLPVGWKWVKLGEVLKVRSGNGLTSKNMLESGFPVYGGNGISGYYSEFMFENPVLILGRVGAKCGVVHFTKPKSWVTDNALIVDSNPNLVDKKYLFWLLYSMDLNQYSVSTAQPVISGAKIYPLEAPLPPLSIQAQIVEKLEALLSELDKGKAQLLTAQAQLKTYRQAVLKYAFEGKFTNKEVKEGELPKNWEWVKIDFMLSDKKKGMITGPFGMMLKKSEHQKEGVAVLGIENIGEGVFQMPNKIFITKEKADDLKNYRVIENDIIISRSGTVGEICLLPKKMENSIISTNLMRVRLNQSIINPKYFVFLFEGGKVRQQVFELCKGSSRAFLNQSILNTLDIPYCSIEEQELIVEEIERRLSVCDKLEETLKVSLAQCETLRQSLLKRAFEGRLV